jgi:hypothetical protein
MQSLFINTNALNECDINRIYHIHEKVYGSKGIGLQYNVWKANLQKKYHGVTDKIVQVFSSSRIIDRIDGYNIILAPIEIENEKWSKIIEGGVNPVYRNSSRITFLTMYDFLLAWDTRINFLGESGKEHLSVYKLLLQMGFHPSFEYTKLRTIFSSFFNNNDFQINCNGSGIDINRKTAINNNYWGFVLIKESTNSKIILNNYVTNEIYNRQFLVCC